MDDGGKAEHVESGSFLIDRAKALDKLKRFQLADAGAFLLSWIRLAVMSDAGRIGIDKTASGLRVLFGGTPLTRTQLKDVYGALFDPGVRDPERGRELAYGLLGLMRLEPRRVTLISGKGPDRVRVRIEGLERETREPFPEGGREETLLEAEWIGGRWKSRRNRCLELARASCALVDIPVMIGGDRAASLLRDKDLDMIYGRGKARLYLRRVSEKDEGRARLYKQGVLAEEIGWLFPERGIAAEVNDDGFSLNASRSAVVRNDRFSKTLARLPGHGAGPFHSMKVLYEKAKGAELRTSVVILGVCVAGFVALAVKGVVQESPGEAVGGAVGAGALLFSVVGLTRFSDYLKRLFAKRRGPRKPL